MQKTIIITSSLAATGLAPAGAQAAQSSPSDPDILTHNVEYQGKAGTVSAYLARSVAASLWLASADRPLEFFSPDMSRILDHP
jgi:hypothetical protein